MKVVSHEIGQVRVFGVIPERFGRVEVWRVGWQPLDLESPMQKGLELAHGGAVRVRTI
jgi:hypothetical protein